MPDYPPRRACPERSFGQACRDGVPERARTSNLLIRSQVLYPIELQVQFVNVRER